MLRVVFDTNVFRPDTFDLIEQSSLIAQYRARRITPIYCPIFLEEVTRAYGIPGKRKELVNRWLPFIEKTTSRITEELPRIFHMELVEGKGPKADFHMRRKVQKYLFSQLRNAPEEGTWNIWEQSKNERDHSDHKRKATHKIIGTMRAQMGEWRRNATQQELNSPTPLYWQYSNNELDNMGRKFMPRLISPANPYAIADVWSRYKDKFPFYTGYIHNMLYLCYYAMTKPNNRIDPNATADLEIMLYLIHADAIVSDEEGFLKTAFHDLWQPKGKLFFSVKEFIQFIG